MLCGHTQNNGLGQSGRAMGVNQGLRSYCFKYLTMAYIILSSYWTLAHFIVQPQYDKFNTQR